MPKFNVQDSKTQKKELIESLYSDRSKFKTLQIESLEENIKLEILESNSEKRGPSPHLVEKQKLEKQPQSNKNILKELSLSQIKESPNKNSMTEGSAHENQNSILKQYKIQITEAEADESAVTPIQIHSNKHEIIYDQLIIEKSEGSHQKLNSSLDLSKVNSDFKKTDTFKDVISRNRVKKKMNNKVILDYQKKKSKMDKVTSTSNHILKAISFDLLNHGSDLDENTPLIVEMTAKNFESRQVANNLITSEKFIGQKLQPMWSSYKDINLSRRGDWGNQIPEYVENGEDKKFYKYLPKFKLPQKENIRKKKFMIIESLIDMRDIQNTLQTIISPVVDTVFEIKVFASQSGYDLESEIYSREIEFIKLGEDFKSGSKFVNGKVFKRGANQGTQEINYGYESRKMRKVMMYIEKQLDQQGSSVMLPFAKVKME